MFTSFRYCSANTSRDTTKHEQATVKTKGRPNLWSQLYKYAETPPSSFLQQTDNILVPRDMSKTQYNSQRGIYLIDCKQTDTGAAVHGVVQKADYKAQVSEGARAASAVQCGVKADSDPATHTQH